jgi:LacI family transcriptional regulator
VGQELPHLLREWSTDGLLLDATASPALSAAVEALGIPAIWINSLLPANCVVPDDAGAGAVAARHLLALGHRILGFAGRSFNHPPERRHHSADARWNGASTACSEAGAACLGPFSFVPGRELDSGCALLRAQPAVTAWIACGGHEAANLYVAAMRLGLRVPEDLSIIAIDANPDAWIGAPFTTVELDWAGVGRQAAEDLITRRDSGGAPTPARVMGTLLALGSTTAGVVAG